MTNSLVYSESFFFQTCSNINKKFLKISNKDKEFILSSLFITDTYSYPRYERWMRRRRSPRRQRTAAIPVPYGKLEKIFSSTISRLFYT